MILKVLMLLVCLQLVDSCQIRCRVRQCEDGWTYYKRNLTGWCMKLVAQENINKTDAENICNASGAVISSIDNMDMFKVVDSLGNGTNLEAWLGAKLIAKCDCGASVCPWIAGCDLNGYVWTDGDTYTIPVDSIDYIMTYGAGESTNGTKTYDLEDSICLPFELGFPITCDSTQLLTSVLCGKPSNN